MHCRTYRKLFVIQEKKTENATKLFRIGAFDSLIYVTYQKINLKKKTRNLI